MLCMQPTHPRTVIRLFLLLLTSLLGFPLLNVATKQGVIRYQRHVVLRPVIDAEVHVVAVAKLGPNRCTQVVL